MPVRRLGTGRGTVYLAGLQLRVRAGRGRWAAGVTHPIVRCLATEEGQAGHTYDVVYFNLTEGPLSEGLPVNAAGLTRTYIPGGGEIIPSTASDASKDGGRETFVVLDESHRYVTPELRRMYATVRRNLDKRKAPNPGPWRPRRCTWQARAASPRTPIPPPGRCRPAARCAALFDHREAPPDVDLTDRDALLAALHGCTGRSPT